MKFTDKVELTGKKASTNMLAGLDAIVPENIAEEIADICHHSAKELTQKIEAILQRQGLNQKKKEVMNCVEDIFLTSNSLG